MKQPSSTRNARKTLAVSASAGNVTFATGGGVGHEGLEFTNATKGNIRFEGDKKFYLAKIKNGGMVTFAGSNALLDLRSTSFSFDTDYNKDPLGAIITKKEKGETIDIQSVAFDGTGTNNIIRSDIPGILTRYLPSAITNHTVRLETFDGFFDRVVDKLTNEQVDPPLLHRFKRKVELPADIAREIDAFAVRKLE